MVGGFRRSPRHERASVSNEAQARRMTWTSGCPAPRYGSPALLHHAREACTRSPAACKLRVPRSGARDGSQPPSAPCLVALLHFASPDEGKQSDEREVGHDRQHKAATVVLNPVIDGWYGMVGRTASKAGAQ